MDRGAVGKAVAGALVAALAARVLLDLLHGPGILGVPVGRLGGGLLAIGGLAAAAAVASDLDRHPLRVPLTLFAVLLAVAGVRSVADPAETARLLLLYASPLAWGLAASATLAEEGRRRAVVLAVAAAAVVPVVVSWVALAAGQAQELVLHDYPRLLGAYTSHHNHAVAMALFVTVGAWLAAAPERRGVRLAGVALAVAAAVPLWLTYVRTSLIFVVLVAGGALLARGRWRWLVGLAALAAAAVLLHPTLRDRFADVVAVLTFDAPEEGWGAVGSWRFRIWADSWQAFAARGPSALLFGLGLGAHRTLHKTLDPHNEYLALWYQMGILGPATYLWMLAVALRDTARAAREAAEPWQRHLAAYAAGLVLAVILTNAISNDFLPRPLLATWVWVLCGAVWAAGPSWGGSGVSPRRG